MSRPANKEHGAHWQYHREKCRCDKCVAWYRDVLRRTRKRRKENLSQGKCNPTHGKTSTYTEYGCRCVLCTEANRHYRAVVQKGRRLALTRAGAIPETVEHGKYSTYKNWGCDCVPCVEAGAEKNQTYYNRYLSSEARSRARKNAYVVGYVDGVTGLESAPESVG